MRSASISRAARVSLATPVLLVVLAACGGGQTTPTATQSTASGSAGPSAASSTPARPLDKKTLLPAVKAAVEKQKTVHVAMSSSGEAAAVKAQADLVFRGTRPDMAVTLDGAAFGTGSVEIRVVGRTTYLSAPPMTPKGKFVEIKPGDRSSLFGGAGGGHVGGVDPREAFDAWRSGLRKVTFLGKVTVGGEQLHHYRITVDLGAAPRPMPQLTTALPRLVTYDLWLDAKALSRRLELRTRHGSMVMQLSHWGEPVSIERPPADQIMHNSAH